MSLAILHDIAGIAPSPTLERVVADAMKGLRREQGFAGRGGRDATPLP